ncbi:hypothetical protein JTE90_007677 [Oedothorax gibbosus]|uniref:Uncharacterized protein n=1 Tax=Oedothorax gibbosus TaxID=931172 RepID=A0AAV6UMT7_9ARAC|nr:hypothetical protein JTE90_007677 [Oedothorax gibbosus]
MQLFLSFSLFLLAFCLPNVQTDNTSDKPDIEAEPLPSHTEMPDVSSKKKTATTQQKQSVLLKTMLLMSESSSSTTSMTTRESLTDSPTTPAMPEEGSSLGDISTETTVTKSLAGNRSTGDPSTTVYVSTTQPTDPDVSTKSMKSSGIAPEIVKVATTESSTSEAMAETTVVSWKIIEDVELEGSTQASTKPPNTFKKQPESSSGAVTKTTVLRVKFTEGKKLEKTTQPSTKSSISFGKEPEISTEYIPKSTAISFRITEESKMSSSKQPTTTVASTTDEDVPKTPSVSDGKVLEDVPLPSLPSMTFENLTASSEEEEVTEEEHNNVVMNTEHESVVSTDSTSTDSTSDKGMEIVVGHKCYKIFQDSILWNDTDGGMLALKSCPPGYQGSMYRPCFSSGKWGNVDYSECRLEHFGRMRHMIVHQVEKGMLGNMYVLAEEFSKYISSVDMKSPMDRLEAFEILNTLLKVDMNLKMDKSRDTKYIQTLLHSCNELIKKKTVLFTPGSQENKLITEKAVEMVFDLTYFAQRSLRGLLKTQKKQIAFRSSPNVVLYLYRGKLSGQLTLKNFTSEYERDFDKAALFNLENTLERSAYALIWIKGLRRLLSTKDLVVNSNVAVTTILSPLNSINHMSHPPTFDVGLRMEKAEVPGYTLKCGQLWNVSKLWNTKDCTKLSVKGDIVTCRCHHLGSIALLLEENSQVEVIPAVYPIGKLISCSCVISLFATLLTLITYYFLLHREEQHLSIFIFVNMITCLLAVQLMLLYGVNRGGQNEVCLSFAIMLHYLFMVLCCWVVAYGVNLLRRLRSNWEYNGRPRDYCAACWFAPGVMLTLAFVLNPEGYETQLYCWMNIERGILWSFVFPVTALILVNTVVMILALKTFNEQLSVTHRLEICKTRNSLRAGITLLPFFAVNWFFGILAVEDSYNLLLQTVFSFTNAMQGILTFIFFCLMDANIVAFFRMKITVVTRRPKGGHQSMKLTKSGSFPILERALIDRRTDCTPLLADRSVYHDTATDDPCCSNIRV